MSDFAAIGIVVAGLLVAGFVYFFVQPLQWWKHRQYLREGAVIKVKPAKDLLGLEKTRISYKGGNILDLSPEPWFWMPEDPTDAALTRQKREQDAATKTKKAGKPSAETRTMAAAETAPKVGALPAQSVNKATTGAGGKVVKKPAKPVRAQEQPSDPEATVANTGPKLHEPEKET